MSVTTYLKGGCANQMFQYAAGLALARRLRTNLLLDNSRYDGQGEWRVYSLGLFRGVTETVVKYLSGKVIREEGLPYDSRYFDQALLAKHQGFSDCSLDGYWQTEKYIAEVRGELRSRLVPREPLPEFHRGMLGLIESEGERSAFLTVRRTDYVVTAFHGLLPMEYYRAAAEVVASRVSDPHFFVFSDEPEWCEANFRLPYRMTVAGNYDRTVKPRLGREDAELELMKACRHAVMANSSYSWWGAWLGRADDGGAVVAPRQWFGQSADADPRDIVPDRWTRI